MPWDELAPGCFRRRYAGPDELDLNIGLVVGAAGVLLVDTGCGPGEAARLTDELRALGVERPRWVVNTHGHYDHCFGNAAFPEAEVHGHHRLAAYLAEHGEANRAELAARSPAWAVEAAAVTLVAPGHPVHGVTTLDLGDRLVQLRALGPGHTAADLVVTVPDAGVVYAGDVLEESAPPAYGPDSYPLGWPDAVNTLLGLVPAGYRLVPGHGDVVDRDFAVRQWGALAEVATELRRLHAAGVPVTEALAEGDWPYERPVLREAVRRGYRQLTEQG